MEERKSFDAEADNQMFAKYLNFDRMKDWKVDVQLIDNEMLKQDLAAAPLAPTLNPSPLPPTEESGGPKASGGTPPPEPALNLDGPGAAPLDKRMSLKSNKT